MNIFIFSQVLFILEFEKILVFPSNTQTNAF